MKEKKTQCERCANEFTLESNIYACSYNCSYCDDCANKLQYICPNCSGTLKQKNSN